MYLFIFVKGKPPKTSSSSFFYHISSRIDCTLKDIYCEKKKDESVSFLFLRWLSKDEYAHLH